MNSVIVTVINVGLIPNQPQNQTASILNTVSSNVTCRSDDGNVTLSFVVPIEQSPLVGTRFSLNLEQLVTVGARIGDNVST